MPLFVHEDIQRFKVANIVALDYDPSTSEVNQLNRIKFMLSVEREKGPTECKDPKILLCSIYSIISIMSSKFSLNCNGCIALSRYPKVKINAT